MSFPLKPFIPFWKEDAVCPRYFLIQFLCMYKIIHFYFAQNGLEWGGGSVEIRRPHGKRRDAFVSFVFPATNPTASTLLYVYILYHEYRKRTQRELGAEWLIFLLRI
jgi:hypothetical protein